MKTIAVYTIDQDARTTSTLGVYDYTRRLVQAMATFPDPGFRVRVWTSPANAADFTPPTLPPWLQVRCVRGGPYGTGWRRLAADHVLVPWLAWREGVDALHVPKGWMPLLGPFGIPVVASLHDTITRYYGEHFPAVGRTLRWRYFDWMMQRSARRAAHVLTISEASAACLESVAPGIRARLTVVAPSEMPESAPLRESPREDAVLVIGSTAPHKATAETLTLLNTYAAHRGHRLAVVLVGLGTLTDLPGVGLLPHLDLRLQGRVSRSQLDAWLAGCRALVFLSHVEGFGLPLLEAYAQGTPVCYRATSAMAEVMAGASGGWDGRSAESFAAALEAVFAMTPAAIAVQRASLQTRYRFRESVAATLAVYARVLGVPPPVCPAG